MKKLPIIIDVFVSIVDNYGDMGFACEFVSALYSEYGDQYECILWTDDVVAMSDFVRKSGIAKTRIGDTGYFGVMRKSAIGISILHTPMPDLSLFAPRALILRVDYLSLDPSWIAQNGSEHILSTPDCQIIELIPSPLEGGAGLIAPVVSLSSRTKQSETTGNMAIQTLEVSNVSVIPGLTRDPVYNKDSSKMTGFLSSQERQGQGKPQKHITIFTYSATLDRIDWESFPSDLIVYVFGIVESKNENIVCLDFLPTREFYTLLDTSEFVIIRGEVTWAHMIQGSVPFFWDMYRDMGGFPTAQSDQFLSLISASSEYRLLHQVLNGEKEGTIVYSDIVGVLSHSGFRGLRTHNLIHTVQKHIDRFHNSI